MISAIFNLDSTTRILSVSSPISAAASSIPGCHRTRPYSSSYLSETRASYQSSVRFDSLTPPDLLSPHSNLPKPPPLETWPSPCHPFPHHPTEPFDTRAPCCCSLLQIRAILLRQPCCSRAFLCKKKGCLESTVAAGHCLRISPNFYAIFGKWDCIVFMVAAALCSMISTIFSLDSTTRILLVSSLISAAASSIRGCHRTRPYSSSYLSRTQTSYQSSVRFDSPTSPDLLSRHPNLPKPPPLETRPSPRHPFPHHPTEPFETRVPCCCSLLQIQAILLRQPCCSRAFLWEMGLHSIHGCSSPLLDDFCHFLSRFHDPDSPGPFPHLRRCLLHPRMRPN